MVITQGSYGALRTVPGPLVPRATLFGLGIGAIIRHSAGAIPTFTESIRPLVAAFRDAVGGPSRFRPEVISASAASATVLSVFIGGGLSSATGLRRRAAAPSTVGFWSGGAVLDRRCP
jgi:hypothetical protein